MIQNNFEKKELIINVIKETKEKIQKNYFETFNLLMQRKIKSSTQSEIDKINNFQLKMDDAMNYTIAKLDYILREENLSLILNKNLSKINDSKEFPYLKSNNDFSDFDNTNNLLNLSEKDINFLSSDELDLIDENLNKFLNNKDLFGKNVDGKNSISKDDFSIKNNKNSINNSKTLFFEDRLAEINNKFEDKLIELSKKEKYFDKAKDEIFLEMSKQDDKFINLKKSLNNNEMFLKLNKSLGEILNKIDILDVKIKSIDQIEQLKPFISHNFNDFNFKIDFFTKNFNEFVKNIDSYQSYNKNNQDYLIQLNENIYSSIQDFKKNSKNSSNVKNKFKEMENILTNQLNDANRFNKEKDELISLLEKKLINFPNKIIDTDDVNNLDNQKNILNKIDILVNNNIFKENLKSNNKEKILSDFITENAEKNNSKKDVTNINGELSNTFNENNLQIFSDIDLNNKANIAIEENFDSSINILNNDFLLNGQNFDSSNKDSNLYNFEKNDDDLLIHETKELVSGDDLLIHETKELINGFDNNFTSSKELDENSQDNNKNDLLGIDSWIKAENKINSDDAKENNDNNNNNFFDINNLENNEMNKNNTKDNNAYSEYSENNSKNLDTLLNNNDAMTDTNFPLTKEKIANNLEKLEKIKIDLEKIDQNLLS